MDTSSQSVSTETQQVDFYEEIHKQEGEEELQEGEEEVVEEEVVEEEKKMQFFPVYVIYSKMSVPKINNYLRKYGSVGFLNVVKDKLGDTNRTIAILSAETFDKLIESGHGTDRRDRRDRKPLTVAPFKLKKSNFPSYNKTRTLFVPIPTAFKADVDNEYVEDKIKKCVEEKLKHLVSWNIIPDDSWRITIPLKSRESGEIRNSCFVSFPREVKTPAVAMVKVLLHDTYWPNDNIFRCFWSRKRNMKEKEE